MNPLTELLRKGTDQPVSVLSVFAVLMTVSIAVFPNNRIELFPPLDIPIYRIITEYPDIPAEEVEKTVTLPLENILSTLGDIRKMESLSRSGISSIVLTFGWNTSADRLGAEIREKIDAVYPSLPDGIRRPVISVEDVNSSSAAVLTVIPNPSVSPRVLYQTVMKELKPRLLRLEGVAHCEIRGLSEPEIKVALDRNKLSASGIGLAEIGSSMKNFLTTIPLGTVQDGFRDRPVIGRIPVAAVEDLKDLPLTAGGSPIRLSDIAKIEQGSKTETSLFRFNGREGIGISLLPKGKSGVLGAAGSLKRALPNLSRRFSGILSMEIVEDGSIPIRRSVNEMGITILLAALSCFIIIRVLFVDKKTAWISLASLPAALLCSSLVMTLAGITFNSISLSGTALALGMVVDNGVVVLENISAGKDSPGGGTVSQTAGGIFGSTLTSTLIFLPILFLPGPMGKIFKDLALSVTILLWSSFFTALYFIPALYEITKDEIPRREKKYIPSGIITMNIRGLRFLFSRPSAGLIIVLITILTGFICLLKIPYQVVPPLPTGIIEGVLVLPSNNSIEKSRQQARKIENSLDKFRGMGNLLIKVGYDKASLTDRGDPRSGINILEITASLKPGIGDRIPELIQTVKEAAFSVDAIPISLTRKLPPLYTLLYRESGDRLIAAGTTREIVRKAVENFSTSFFHLDAYPRKDFLRFRYQYNNSWLAKTGTGLDEIALSMRIGTEGIIPAAMDIKGIAADIHLSLQNHQINSLEKIKRIPVSKDQSVGTSGEFHPLFTEKELHRINRNPCLFITYEEGNIPAGWDRGKISSRLSALAGPGVWVIPEEETFSGNTIILFLVSLLLMYFAMGAQFNSLAAPLLLLLLIPLSVSGSLFLLILTGKSLNLSSFLGILITTGVCLNGGILLTDSFKGSGKKAIIISSVKRRSLSLAAGTLTTLFSLIPMVLFLSGTNEFQAQCAIAVMGGAIFTLPGVQLLYPFLFNFTRGSINEQ